MTFTINADQPTETLSNEIKEACKSTGFLYLTNTGIDSKEVFKISQNFFQDTSASDKADYRITTANEGYVNFGDELLDPSQPDKDLKEAFNFGVKSAFVDNSQSLPETFKGNNFQTLKEFSTNCYNLGIKLLHAFALSLDLESDYFTKFHSSSAPNSSTFRMLYYPPVEATTSNGSLRAGAHSDYGSLTFLFQNSEISGLQILKNGVWEDVEPVPNAVLVNIGDIMEFWTGGQFKSTTHRVVKPKMTEQSKPRQSLAYFFHPDDDAIVNAMDTTVESIKGLSTETSLTAYEYLHQRLRATYTSRKDV
ncbi:Clavaminate synthase-like protein [Wallemia mellicola CBS 633.66]|uniref:Clavaminate synthase-like protein n=1 Tax=Wallemia mellicola (strain ATCC MYA-4683 / CBS 633.66) TaxID=671144 RepID=I4Y936_WALMC|nr:Clavaminate synthase-like protein [Wallemia mellicola CBS 633.66]EIM20478.1 Clavaminate synthase-like protein [Wallemia mellicola CBS 633.66]|eukprot:XP_006959504.1 Clavaminate synthase-like protein [Wallemia mellicola CBS 633.66]